MVQYTQQQRSVIVTSSNVARVSQNYAQSDLVADFETQRLRDLTQSLTAVIRSISLRGRCIKKGKNKTISDGGITVDFSIIKVHTSN